jgi:hypothetical protein
VPSSKIMSRCLIPRAWKYEGESDAALDKVRKNVLERLGDRSRAVEGRKGARKGGPLGVGGSDDACGLVLRRCKGQEGRRDPVEVTHVDSLVLFVSACLLVIYSQLEVNV